MVEKCNFYFDDIIEGVMMTISDKNFKVEFFFTYS